MYMAMTQRKIIRENFEMLGKDEAVMTSGTQVIFHQYWLTATVEEIIVGDIPYNRRRGRGIRSRWGGHEYHSCRERWIALPEKYL